MNTKRSSDESYIIDLCDSILKTKAKRQHPFDFLLGDIGKNGRRKPLPVDGYYESLSLAIEYKEKQHTEAIAHFDKPNKLTVSGVHRGEQRRIYDQRRREVLPKHGIKLIEISFSIFENKRGKLIRNLERDKSTIMKLLLEAGLVIVD